MKLLFIGEGEKLTIFSEEDKGKVSFIMKDAILSDFNISQSLAIPVLGGNIWKQTPEHHKIELTLFVKAEDMIIESMDTKYEKDKALAQINAELNEYISTKMDSRTKKIIKDITNYIQEKLRPYKVAKAL